MNNKILHLVFLLLFAAGCIKEIQLKTETGDLSTLIISGDFTNSNGKHVLQLTQPSPYGVSSFGHVGGALVTLFDDNGNSAPYTEVFNPQGFAYELAANAMPAVPGRAYHIEIVLPDGETYRSEPQVLLPVIPVDTLLVEARTVNRTTGAGVVVQDRLGFVDAQTTIPANETQVFFRWQSDCVYFFPEQPLPGPLPPPTRKCYVTEYLTEQQAVVLSLDNQNGRTIRTPIAGKRIDKAFEFKAFYNVVQKRISADAFDYFDRISKIANPEGTVFDTPPGTLKGNCYNVNNPSRVPLGYFEVAAVDTFRVSLNGSFFGADFNYAPHCTQDDYYFNRDQECFDCLLLKNSTYERPYYFD